MFNSLENIIRTTSKDHSIVDTENERLIILDEKTGEFFYEENLGIRAGRFIGRKYSYHIVNFNEFVKINDLDCEFSDPKEGMTIKLKVSFELSIIKGRAIKAIHFFKNPRDSHGSLERSFANWIRNFVADHPNFTDDFFRLEGPLRGHIENQAARKGLRIRVTRIDPSISDDLPNAPSHISVVHTTKCEIMDDTIEVKNKIVVNLLNRRVPSWKNIDDPEKWIKDKTDTIIQNELINKTFIGIVDRFETDIKPNIVNKLESAVRDIGYSIQHIISVPSEEIAEFLGGFTFHLNDNEAYGTSNAEIQVRLSITIEGKGSTIKGIDPKYIKPRRSIIQEVKKLSREQVAAILRETDPEDYYTSFDDVSIKIKKRVQRALGDSFNIPPRDFKIFISFLKTDLKERFDLLFAERGKISIESHSQSTGYEIKYGVHYVNDWHVFHKNHIKYHGKTALEYQDISEYLKNEIELDVKRRAGNTIDITNSRVLDQGIKRLFKNAQNIVTEEFGLQLGPPRLKRTSDPDLDDGEIYANAYLAKREKIKHELKEALLADDDGLVEELTGKLKKISTDIKKIADSNNELLESPDSKDVPQKKEEDGGE
ncbi:MAG: hypothetical protein AB3N16_11445 [Flavobacteriaceae bacterium]